MYSVLNYLPKQSKLTIFVLFLLIILRYFFTDAIFDEIFSFTEIFVHDISWGLIMLITKFYENGYTSIYSQKISLNKC